MKKVNGRPNSIGLKYIFKKILWEKKKRFWYNFHEKYIKLAAK